MKICLVHHEYPEETSMGGIATYQRMLALTLKNMGHDVTIIAASLDEDKEYDDNGIRVIRFNKCIQYDTIPYMKKYREKVADKLHELYLNNELDVIESPEMGAECLIYINKYHDVPVICKLHTSFEIWAEFNDTTLPKKVHNQLVQWEREYINKADFVTSCTNLLLNMMIERKQIQRNDVIVLGNPANIENFKKIKCERDNSILYLGGLEQRKGVLVLAKAIPLVLQKIPALKFKFIGANTNSNDKNISTIDYIKEIVPNKFHKNLEFIGHINNNEVSSYCSKSVIGVVPSSFDNLPYVAMEELLCELPLIASDNTGVVEMITDNKSGILFKNGDYIDLANKIVYLYNNENIRKNMGILGRNAIIEKFSPKQIALKTVDIYQDAINIFTIRKIYTDLTSIIRIPFGIANFVYKLQDSNGVYIAKCYRERMKKNEFCPIVYDKNLKKFSNFVNIFSDKSITITKFIEGDHKKNLTNQDIEVIIDFFKYFSSLNYKALNLKDKINQYKLDYYPKRNEIQYNLNKFWKDNLPEIELLLSKNLVLSHGDLSITNILFSENLIGFIDFDEVCLAPKYYDLAVLIVKFCFIDGVWNKEFAIKILKKYISKNKNFNYNEFKITILLYLYKLLEEKFYWEKRGLIDLEDVNQKKDYFLDYYKLFIDFKNKLKKNKE